MKKSIHCSIIIPAYNSERTIKHCLDSLQLDINSKYGIEVIVVNDGSSDATANIVQNYLRGISGCCKLINKENGGVSSARNVGINYARGDYIYFIDSDDVIIRESLDEMISVAINNDCDLVMAKFIKNTTKNINEKLDFFPTDCLLDRDYIIKFMLPLFITGNLYGLATTCNKLYKRKVIIENKLLFDEKRTHGEDLAFNLNYIDFSNNFFAINRIVYIYNQNGSQGDFEKYSKGFGYGLIESYKKTLEINREYCFFDDNGQEMKIAAKRFVALSIAYLELNNICNKDKRKFLKDHLFKSALEKLYSLKTGEIPGWTKRNHFAILLLKLKQYKLLLFLHYKFKLKLLPA